MKLVKWLSISSAVLSSVLIAVTASAQEDELFPGEDHFWARFKEVPLDGLELDVSGSLRLRLESQHNFNIKKYAEGTKDTFFLERLRLDFDFKFQPNLHAFVRLQDSEIYDGDFHTDEFSPNNPYENPFDLREAFVEWTQIADSPFGFKIGRQCICYADNRIFGPGDWGNVGRYAWDAIKLIVETDPVAVDFFTAQRVVFDPHDMDEQHFKFDAWAAYVRFKKLPMELDLFWVYRRDHHWKTVGESGRGNTDRYTVGFRTRGRLAKSWDYAGTFAYQYGDYGNDSIRAYGYHASLGYTFEAPWEPRLAVQYTYAAGDSNANDGTHETFDGVFGAIDQLYGRMNLLAWMNLQDYQLSAEVKPCKGCKVSLDWHYFRLAENKDAWYYCNGRPQRRDAAGTSGRSLGQEVDLVGKCAISRTLDLMTGYAHFWPGAFIKRTGRHTSADWWFLQLTYRF